MAIADPSCVDRQEAAGLKSPSLMQVNTGTVTTHSIETSSDSLVGFSQMVEDLAEKVAGHNYTLSKAESDALELIRTWIENMNNTLKLQHKEDQDEVNRVRDLIKQCTDSTNTMLSTNVSGYNQTTNSWRISHRNCRIKEQGEWEKKSLACKDYDRYRKGLNPYLNGDEVPPNCLSSLDEAKVETTDAATREDMETCLVETHTWLLPLYQRYRLCQRSTGIKDNTTRTCDQKQWKFEQSFCLYALKLSDTCDDHTTCRNKELAVRSATHSEVRVSEQARKADYVTGQKINCLFDVFLADNPNKTKTLNRCRALKVDTSPFDITYPDAPGPAPCTKEPNKPCDEAWKAKEYSNSSLTYGTCTPCPSPTPPTPVQQVYTAGIHTVTVDQETRVTVSLWGAGGGGPMDKGNNNGGGDPNRDSDLDNTGGGGGYAGGIIKLQPGVQYTIEVGNGGTCRNGDYGNSCSGGGYTGIFAGSPSQSTALLVAGGGGGGGTCFYSKAGAGGGASGQDAITYKSYQGQAAKGGSQAAGGAGGKDSAGNVGVTGTAMMRGGPSMNGNGCDGGGGGGGYWGGGHGSPWYAASGGGGSGFVHSSLVLKGRTAMGNYAAPAEESDVDRANAGRGGGTAAQNGNPNGAEDGIAVITT